VKLALLPPARAGVGADPDWIVAYARHAEALGFESIVAIEHPLVISSYTSTYPYADSGRMPLPDACPIPDPLELLAFVAAATTTLGLSTGVLVLPAHHPVVLAKRLATLDVLSKGRLRLCIGLGWMREELEACGTAFSSRGRRADESIDVMRALWADSGPEGASFEGEFFSFDHAHSFPKPVQPGGVPIHVGGHSPGSIRRAATRGDGWQPLGIAGDELKDAIARVRQAAADAGRDADALEVTISALAPDVRPSTLERAAASGVDRVVATTLEPRIDAALDDLSSLAERVGLRP
jgi:probable F420-dependent oxidoreductase